MSDNSSSNHFSASGGSNHVNKTGRKGDPRMHRAVAARLANPDLSLYEALRIGGFDYEMDDDARALDNDKVTLGQRKNQLSRRIRFAKKHGQTSQYATSPNPDEQGKHPNSSSAYNGTSNKPSLNGAASSAGQGADARGQKRPASAAMTDELEEVNVRAERAAAVVAETEDRGMHMKAKNHPDFHPILVAPTASAVGGSILQRAQTANAQAPFFGQQMLNQSTTASLSTDQQLQQAHQQRLLLQQQQQQQQQQAMAAAAAPIPYASLQQQSVAAPSESPAVAPTQGLGLANRRTAPSGVAVNALTSTAKRFGMSLEQMALALSQCQNLDEVLSGDPIVGPPVAAPKRSDPEVNDFPSATSDDKKVDKQDLALNLYQNDNHAMYARCMLLAGYPVEQTTQSSDEFIDFAFKAWQLEGKWIQDLMDDRQINNNNRNFGSGSAGNHQRRMGNGNSNNINRGRDNKYEQPRDHHLYDPSVGRKDPTNGREHRGRSLSRGRRRRRSYSDDYDDYSQGSYERYKETRNRSRSRRDTVSPDCCAVHNGHHLHRLEGCGHKAIVHKPEDGPVHIDFVVGNKVECYHGVRPLQGQKSRPINAWPSTYKCQELKCKSPCPSELNEIRHSDECLQSGLPRTLDLSDIDFTGEEWGANSTDGQIDESLLGLFKLSTDSRSCSEEKCSEEKCSAV